MAKGIASTDPIFQLKNSKERDRFYGKLDEVQKDYNQTIVDTAVTCCNARAGTGKTFIATLAALKNWNIKKKLKNTWRNQIND